MPEPRVIISVIARGHWYPQGVERMRKAFAETDPNIEIQEWQSPPPGAPTEEIIESDWDYSGYVWKPFGLKAALDSGADCAIQLDAAFWPIRSIKPLVDYIMETGYYACDNGAPVGEWSSDRCLELMHTTREAAFKINEASSYCLGMSRRSWKAIQFVRAWMEAASIRGIFEGHHTAGVATEGVRNPGFVSTDPRVRGHRNDQTAASIILWRLGMRELVRRPRFTTYDGHQDETTVMVNRGL